jgi:hypothetical protein
MTARGTSGAAVAAAMAALSLASAAPLHGAPVDRAPLAALARHEPLPVSAAVVAAVQQHGWADVLVSFDGVRDSAAPLAELAAAVAESRTGPLAALGPADFRLSKTYEYFPVAAGRISASGLRKLRADPRVLAVDADEWLYPLGPLPRGLALAESVPSIEAEKVHALGIQGAGIGVAVVDTGIDNDHPDLQPAIIDQQCFSSASRSCAPSGLPRSPNAEDEQGHGTAVSGIVLGRGNVAPVGVAPEANLIGVRVFRDQGGAPTQDIVDGLNWVVARQSADNIRVVNMSLGGGAAIGVNCDDQYTGVKQVFQTLVNRNVAIFVATGNGGNTDRVAFPACISNATGVGATWDAELRLGSPDCHGKTTVGPLDITCYTDRGRAMDLVAPGSVIASSRMGGGATGGGHGTSFAAPHAAGVAALIFSAYPRLHARDVERVMRNAGDLVIHPESGLEVRRVNALKAVLAVLPATPTPSATAPVTVTSTPTAPTDEPTVTATPSEPAETPDGTPTATSPPTAPPVEHTIYLPYGRR